ncbi:hypothetical protein JTB14_010808 [Gonioctena quinquepunctata]|nr:hypothetical protein JTB14_010808 [Gonioctena quinquepunctata]
MLRDSIEDSTDSKIFPANFWDNGNFNGLADELAKQKVNHFHNGVILKNEGNDDSPTNNVESKMKALKNEDDIDIIYEDVKPEICEEKTSEKGSYMNSVPDKSIGTTFSHELSKGFETWPQQNIEEDGTAVERDKDTRKESHQCKVCSKWFDRKMRLQKILQHISGKIGISMVLLVN